MKLTVESAAFAAAVGRAKRIVPPRGFVEIIKMLRLEALGDRQALEIRAFNMEIEYRETIPAKVEVLGATCADTMKLAAIAGGAPEGSEIAMTMGDPQLAISCGRARYRLDVLPVADWHEAEPIRAESTGTPAAPFVALLKRVAPAVSTNELSKGQQGVFLHEREERTLAVASNSRVVFLGGMDARLALPDHGAIVTPEAVAGIAATLDGAETATVAVSPYAISVATPGGLRACRARLLAFDFPYYENVIPRMEALGMVSCAAADLRAALRRIEAFGFESKGSGHRGNLISFKAGGGEIKLLGATSGHGDAMSASDAIPAECGCEWQGGMNARHLEMLAEAIGDETLRLTFYGDDDPVTATSEDGFFALIAPTRHAFPQDIAEAA